MEAPKEESRSQAPQQIPGWLRALFGVPLIGFGGLITFIVGSFLLGYLASRIGGGRASSAAIRICALWVIFGAFPLVAGRWLLGNGTKLLVSRKFGIALFVVALVIVADASFGPANWRKAFRSEKTLHTDAGNLRGTFVTPQLDAEVHPGTNLIWCGTFQLAWNEACKLAGGDLRLVSPNIDSLVQNPMADALNQHSFTKDYVDNASYVALAAFTKDNIREKIVGTVKEKLGFTAQLLPDKSLTPRPQDFVAYACLYKRLSFPTPFERLDDPFHFGDKQVRGFGIGKAKASRETMRSQVLILDYQDQNDFVIEIKTASTNDRLILAEIRPEGTLGQTVKKVRDRAEKAEAQQAETNDVLVVPKISFDVLREYWEIENHWLVPVNRSIAHDLLLLSAQQSIKFEMNENGVELRSEAHMAFGCGREAEPRRPHIMIFDKPFLLMLERKGAPMPYFALWIDNPELLVPW